MGVARNGLVEEEEEGVVRAEGGEELRQIYASAYTHYPVTLNEEQVRHLTPVSGLVHGP